MSWNSRNSICIGHYLYAKVGLPCCWKIFFSHIRKLKGFCVVTYSSSQQTQWILMFVVTSWDWIHTDPSPFFLLGLGVEVGKHTPLFLRCRYNSYFLTLLLLVVQIFESKEIRYWEGNPNVAGDASLETGVWNRHYPGGESPTHLCQYIVIYRNDTLVLTILMQHFGQRIP